MQHTAEVVIIGGGVIGCSTAYYLAKHGVRNVTVIEMSEIGAGSSSKSAAMLSLQFCRDALSLQMAQHSYAAYMYFEDELGVSTDFHKTGWLYLATEESADALRQQASLLKAHGVATQILSTDEIQSTYPQLNTEDIVLGTFGPDDGPFDPHMIMSGYIKKAKQLGVKVYEGEQVFEVVLQGDRVTGVVTNKREISAGTVVNAAGPWAAQVGQLVGAHIPLLNSARTIVVTNPIAAIPSDYPFVEDLSTEWYFRPEMHGVLMGMGARQVERPNVDLDDDQVAAIVETAVYRVPALARASLLTAWTGVRPLTPDGHPFVGSYSGIDGFILNCGWGGVGFIMAPIAGQLIAEYVTQGKVKTIDGSALSPDRFASGYHR